MPLKWLYEIEIARINRVDVVLPPPIYDFDDNPKDADFVGFEKILVEELADRRANPKQSANSTNGWIKSVCYNIILAHINLGEEGQFEQVIEDRGRLQRGLQTDRNIFELGLVALFANNPRIFTPTSRRRLADAMWYGHRHCIPPALLNGFNHQYPGHLKDDPHWERTIEPALVSWVIEQRYQHEEEWGCLDASRGPYDLTIEDALADLRSERDRANRQLSGRNSIIMNDDEEEEDW